MALGKTRASAMTMGTQIEATILMPNKRAKAMVRREASVNSTDSGQVMVVMAAMARPPKVRVVHTAGPLKATAITVDPSMDMPLALKVLIEGE